MGLNQRTRCCGCVVEPGVQVVSDIASGVDGQRGRAVYIRIARFLPDGHRADR